MRSFLAIAIIAALTASAMGFWLFSASPGESFAISAEDRSVFFRLQAKYQHRDETIEFDVIVGCAVHVTNYADGGSSYDAFRAPTVYAKATRDGGAIWQLVPHACNGQTTESGRIPEDFIPGAIWFSDKSDFSLGTGYFTESAYEKADADLKFLGARISKASREEWNAFQPTLAENLIDPKPFSILAPWPSEAEARANLWNKAKLNERWLGSFSCRGVERLQLSDPAARAVLQKYWPASRPRFWRHPYALLKDIKRELHATANHKGPLVDGLPYRRYFFYEHAGGGGFPTRAGGGRLDSRGELPSEIFPLRADEGIPWVHPGITHAPTIYRDIEFTGDRQGLTYCYSLLEGRGTAGEMHLPGWPTRKFETRVNGTPIHNSTNNGEMRVPEIFFEEDKYLYRSFSFGWG